MKIESSHTPEEQTQQLAELVQTLREKGRMDLLLRAVGVSVLEELRIEAARARLSRLQIASDYRFILVDYGNREIELQPIHKAVYLLFLAHPEGIEFKRLSEYKGELLKYYMATAKSLDKQKIEEGVEHLVNPLDNAINEKCSRIKRAFLEIMDEYTANYYIIGSHAHRHAAETSHVWYKRIKVITLPRELIIW